MKIIGDLFQTGDFISDNSGAEGTGIHCSATLLPVMESVVFAAHFPGHPIVPGACIVAAVGELASRALNQQCQVSFVKNVKFISLIEPEANIPVRFDLDIDLESKKVKAIVQYRGAVCCKLSLTLSNDY